MENKNKVSSTKLGIIYSIPSFLWGMLAKMENTFFIFFLTNIALLSTAGMAKVTSIGATLIAFSSLFSGIIMQSVTFKSGKYRPWLIYGGIAVLIGRFMQFTALPNKSEGFLVAWFLIGYVLMNFAFSFTTTSYNSLILVVAPNSDTRMKINSWKNLANSVMQLIFGATAVGFIAKFGQTAAAGYAIYGNMTSILFFAGCLFLWSISKNEDTTVAATAATEVKVEDKTKVNIWEMVKYSFGNKNTILFLLAMWCKVASSLLINFSLAYYYTYNVGSKALLTTYLTLSTFITIIACYLTPFIAKIFKGSRNTYGSAMVGYFAVFVLAFLLKSNPVIVTILIAINQFFWGIYQSAELPLFMGVIDYTEYKTGKDLTAFMMSIWTFAIKIGIIIANSTLAFGLLKIGFEAKAVTDSAISKIPIIVFLFPAGYAILGAIFAFLIPLTDDKIAEYHEKNQASKAAK